MSRTLMYQLRQEVNLDDPSPFSAAKPSRPAGAGTAGSTGAKAGAAGKPPEGKDAGEPEKDTQKPDADAAGKAEPGE